MNIENTRIYGKKIKLRRLSYLVHLVLNFLFFKPQHLNLVIEGLKHASRAWFNVLLASLA